MIPSAQEDNCRDFLAQKLPEEVWSIIFIKCLASFDCLEEKFGEVQGGLKDPRLVPLALTSVCRTWRCIAYSTPQLWATCYLNFYHPENNTIWLERSGALMLHLYGELPRSRDAHPKMRTWEPFFLSILPFQGRWETFELDTGDGNTISDEAMPEFDTPALKTFRISGYTPSWTIDLLSRSLQLQQLTLSYTWFNLLILYLPSLSTLTINLTTPKMVTLLLLHFPHLQNLDVFIVDSAQTILGIATHTSLLSLSVDGKFHTSILFDNLSLPSLHTLKITGFLDMTSCLSFLRRSGCRMTEFTLGGITLSCEDLMLLLKDDSIHSIEKLELSADDAHWENIFLTPILDFFQDKRNLPHLSHLFLLNHVFDHQTRDGILADMVISRRGPRVCRCEECCVNPQPGRKASLEHVTIDGINAQAHALDVARLVPLPGEGVEGPEGASMSLELGLMEYPAFLDLYRETWTQKQWKVQSWVGNGLRGKGGLDDDL